MDFHIYRREDASQVFVAIKKLAAGISMYSFKLVHLLTASSELMSNMVKYAGNGTVTLSLDSREIRQKIVVVFNDKGPGIPDPELAMTPGYSTGKTLGIGLSGAKRLCDEFSLNTEVGKGTTNMIVKSV